MTECGFGAIFSYFSVIFYLHHLSEYAIFTTEFIISTGKTLMRKLILTYLIVFVSAVVYGESRATTFTLDKALVKVVYERLMARDTLDPQNIKSDYLTLQAGKKGTAFYCEELRREDSLEKASAEYMIQTLKDKEKNKRIARLEKEVVFRRYDLNQTWSHLRFDITNWILYENLEKPEWKITNETDIVLGFLCIKATTFFRGREWTAFFTPDIPVPEGPWKLCGLPGLILKAYDSKKHYSYEAKDINTSSPGLVEYFNLRDRSVLKDRIKALCLRKKALSVNIADIICAARGIKRNPKRVEEDKRNANHDFEEIDYPHTPQSEKAKK